MEVFVQNSSIYCIFWLPSVTDRFNPNNQFPDPICYSNTLPGCAASSSPAPLGTGRYIHFLLGGCWAGTETRSHIRCETTDSVSTHRPVVPSLVRPGLLFSDTWPPPPDFTDLHLTRTMSRASLHPPLPTTIYTVVSTP